MSLDCILLGILREPAAGYDIKQYFDNVFRHFWSADIAQIYRALNRMEKDGLLTSRMEPSDKGPDRKVYRRTEAGKQLLDEWLQAGPVFGSEKFTYLAQIFFLDQAEPLQTEEFFSTLREELVARLETLMAIKQTWLSEHPEYADSAQMPDEEFFPYLTLDMGLRKTQALVEWADASLDKIRKRNQNKTKGD